MCKIHTNKRMDLKQLNYISVINTQNNNYEVFEFRQSV